MPSGTGEASDREQESASTPVDVEGAIAKVREAVSEGEASEKELCSILLQSNDPSRRAEAFGLCEKNIGTLWGRLWLFKMHFNGIATERDIKAALRILYSDTSVVRSDRGSQL